MVGAAQTFAQLCDDPDQDQPRFPEMEALVGPCEAFQEFAVDGFDHGAQRRWNLFGLPCSP